MYRAYSEPRVTEKNANAFNRSVYKPSIEMLDEATLQIFGCKPREWQVKLTEIY
jgi:hypothetical protein